MIDGFRKHYEIDTAYPIYWKDIQVIRNLNREHFFNNKYIGDDEHHMFMQKNYKNYIVLIIDKTIGFAGIVNNDIRIAIHPFYKSLGWGSVLLNELINRYSHIFPNMEARVDINNVASIKLFASCGFDQYSQRIIFRLSDE